MATVIDLPEHRPVDRRFVAMLGLSLALHAALLAWTHGPQQEMTPAQVLSATLRMVIPEAVQAPAPLAEPITSTPIPDVRRVRDMPPSRRHEAASSVAVPAEMPRPTTDGPPAQAPVAVVAEALPPPKVGPNQANLLDAYGRLLAGLLSRHQEYPRLAAMRGWEGEVLIRLRVARKGNLLGVQVDRSSGFEILDRHALSILEQLPGLPPLPEGVEGNEIQVVVPVSYRLKKAS